LYGWNRHQSEITKLSIEVRRDQFGWTRKAVAKLLKDVKKPRAD
jgi:hypothetical protein